MVSLVSRKTLAFYALQQKQMFFILPSDEDWLILCSDDAPLMNPCCSWYLTQNTKHAINPTVRKAATGDTILCIVSLYDCLFTMLFLFWLLLRESEKIYHVWKKRNIL